MKCKECGGEKIEVNDNTPAGLVWLKELPKKFCHCEQTWKIGCNCKEEFKELVERVRKESWEQYCGDQCIDRALDDILEKLTD